MTVLLLSNGAPGYHNFFNPLVREFARQGYDVIVAVDNPYSRESNRLDQLGFPVYDFSDFFRRGDHDFKLLEKYSRFNINAALLSDFERNEIYRIDPSRTGGLYEKLSVALLSFFEMIFERYSITEVLYEGVSNSFAHFAYFVACSRKARYKGLISSRLPGRYAITADPCGESAALMASLQRIRSGEIEVPIAVRQWCERYLNSIETTAPDYMKFNSLDKVDLVSRYFKLSKLDKLRRAWRFRNADHEAAFQLGNPLRHSAMMVVRNLTRRLRLAKVVRLYEAPVAGEAFYLYPLHFHPEASTSILAGTYLDEYEVIRNIAFNLPVGARLYVKDHVSAYGFQSLSFYRKIKKLPNVRLLGPNEKTKALIKLSRAVITLTSTVGYEAVLLGKRVFLYGRVFYECHPNVVRIGQPSHLFDILNEYSGDISQDNRYNMDFLAAYYSVTRPGSLNLMADEQACAALAKEVFDDVMNYSEEPVWR